MFGAGGKLKGYGPVGIALATDAVYLAQRDARGAFHFASQRLAEGIDAADPTYHTEVSRGIASSMRRTKFTGKLAVSALPSELLQYKTLRLPPMPDEELVQAVAWEAAERYQIGEDQVLQYYNAGEVKQGNELRQELILLATDRATVHDHASSVKRAGLVPIAIDATGAALARVLGADGQTTLIVYLGQNQAEIVGTRGTLVIFNKPITLTRDHAGIDAAALSRELGLCLRYLSVTFGLHKPDAAWIAGLGVTPNFLTDLNSQLITPIQPVIQSPLLQDIPFPERDPSPWLVSLGLSLREEKANVLKGAA